MFGREVLGEVIGKVFNSLLTVESKLVLLGAAAHQVEAYVKSFGELLAHVAVEDSVGGCAVGLDWVGGCGWPVLIRAVRIGSACWLLKNIDPVSASALEAMTLRMV